ncbi:RNA-directed RNA polymerase [Ranunculus cassubicifolius]
MENDKEMILTQVSFGGFDESATAKELTHFLEYHFGMIWRCRLKSSWTPPESYPNFDVADIKSVQRTDDYEKVRPHAFVHFATTKGALGAKNAAGRCELIYKMNPLVVNLGPESSSHTNQRRRKMDPFKFQDVNVQIGTLVSVNEFCTGWKGASSGVDFVVDPFDGTCKILFTKETAFAFKGTSRHAVLKCDYKMEFLVREIAEIKQYNDIASLVLLIQLSSSPHVFYRTADDDIYVSVPYDLLDDEDPWIRTTDFTPGGVIGRCNWYRISVSPRFGPKLNKAMKYIKERRVLYSQIRHLKLLEEPSAPTPPNSFFCIPCKIDLSFDIIYMVNAVMHKGIFNQYQLSDRFFELLKSQSREVNIKALNHIYCYKRPVFDAYRRLKLVQEWILKNPKALKSSKVSDNNMEVNRLVITPTRAYCLPPEVELSNRVLRKYKEVADRFLRVTFMDEGFQSLNNFVCSYYVAPIVKEITSNSFPQKTTIFKRVKTILSDGFYMCGRKYYFLAFSSNQLRDRSAWFFADSENIKVSDIKSWMGKFTNKNVAKCAARMGQCFSSTYETIRAPRNEVNFDFPDIERNDYVFSDGIGIITPDLAAEVAEKLQLTENPPSAYQIRYAGCKGVIASWPGQEDGIRLYLRPSMNKFESKHDIIEVVSWTRFQPGFLNRQIIILLSSLDVPNEVFLKLQDSMVYKLDQMLNDNDIALDVIISSCGDEGNTAALMLSAGFKPQTEPHLKGMLTCIRAAQQGDLLDKARIFVPSSRWLMGCLDELALLEQGQCFIQISNPSLEHCFVKHGFKVSETNSNLKVVTGTVVMAKNPCLHPGDVRILEAVDVPALRHLVDCLVFPQKGDRPHANEASGSDLDGDLYFVTWDEDLVPPSKRSWPPMDYTPVEVKTLPRPVNHQDIIEFFTKNMVNENLGVICNAHVVQADRSEYGALDEKCIKLAELAATAVDFPKTGKLVTMPTSLKPKTYPDFMAKEEFVTYTSKKVLGILYRKIKNAFQEDKPSSSSILPRSPEGITYDAALEVPCSEDLIQEAWNQKCLYDGQLNALLGQYRVSTEEEVVSGHIWSMPRYDSRKQRELKERLKHAYHALRKEFRKVFDKVDTSEELSSDLKIKMYEQKASAWYQVTYHPKWVKTSLELRRIEEDDDSVPAFLSFAWIPVEYLARIKVRHLGIENFDSLKPKNSLAQYLDSHES